MYMRRLFIGCLVAAVSVAAAVAEPLVLEQASQVVSKGFLEVGLAEITYQSDETKITNDAGTVLNTITRTALDAPVFARYGITPNIEASLSLPYRSLSSKNEAAGGTSVSESDAGLADPTIAGKYSFTYKGWNLAAATAITIAAGKESTKLPAEFKRSLAIKPLFAAQKQVGCMLLNSNIAYAINAEFTDENSVKQQYGNVLSLGIGTEYALKKYEGVTVIGEILYNSLGESKSAGVAQDGTAGSQYGIALGGRYDKGDWKTKLGLDLSLGEEKYRAYDYRIIAGVTYLISL
jgi:hypothetical protein